MPHIVIRAKTRMNERTSIIHPCLAFKDAAAAVPGAAVRSDAGPSGLRHAAVPALRAPATLRQRK